MKAATLLEPRNASLLTGITEAAAPAFAAQLLIDHACPVTVMVVRNFKLIEQWTQDVPFFARLCKGQEEIPYEVQALPELPSTDEDDSRYFELHCDRLTTLTRLNDFREGLPSPRNLVVLATPRGLLHRTPRRSELTDREVRLRTGKPYSFSELIDQLNSRLGYYCEALCETPGQYAVRGGLIDIYPVNGASPYRIDFFGDEIEEIRAYDPTTQRSEASITELTLTAMPSPLLQERESHIFDYLPDKVCWIFYEPSVLAEDAPGLFHYPERMPPSLPTFQDLFEHRDAFPDVWTGMVDIDAGDPMFGDECRKISRPTEPLGNYRSFVLETEFGVDRLEAEQGARIQFLRQLLDWQRDDHALFFVSQNEGQEKRLQEILKEDDALASLRLHALRGEINAGFRWLNDPGGPATLSWPDTESKSGIVVVTDSEIFGRYRLRPLGTRRRRLPVRAQVDQLLDFSELADGDFLVHLQHGICIYRDITRMEVREKSEEVITLEFDDDITLHLPLHESHLLTRYVGLAKVRPKLGRLGTGAWEKTRRAAEQATIDLAAQLLELQARRNLNQGHAFGPDTEWQREFEESFIHRETRDQLTSIEETKSDMELSKPMERLICGDVGFGKTEVVLRAAFKAVLESRQVALLVPTTVLAQQHFNTFRERMADYPVSIEMLSRFRSRAQQAEILRQAKQGTIDITIGTHRLLSRDVQFRDLGLLIIDEEHRFGVRHKERLKRLRENVDVIALSATPIPRTLYLALMGARDLSVIDTPPADRLPITTIVKSYDPKLVKEAIAFEIERGGQVFYLHNRVQTIDAVAWRLQELLPDARVAIGHGQMAEHDLEQIMTRFVAGEFDILVCTTIIESGLDIPNCNTIIIEGADRFGLSQLYQLRGRVGRFNRQAYAYLLLHRHTHLLDTARKRLSAMRQYTQLGAGFKIAMRDLELRGAGNLLGAQQSGHIAGVGFDLYCQLLRQSVSRLKGEQSAIRIRASLRLDFVIIGEQREAYSQEASPLSDFDALKADELSRGKIAQIEAFIPHAYMEETRLRIDFYRRLAMSDSTAVVGEIAESMIDRFGPYPGQVEALLLMTEIRCLAEQSSVLTVESEGDRLKCLRATGKHDDCIKFGNRFPRLTRRAGISRLREIRKFLKRYVL